MNLSEAITALLEGAEVSRPVVNQRRAMLLLKDGANDDFIHREQYCCIVKPVALYTQFDAVGEKFNFSRDKIQFGYWRSGEDRRGEFRWRVVNDSLETRSLCVGQLTDLMPIEALTGGAFE